MFELTYRCSEACIHCYNIGATRNNEERSGRAKLIELTLDEYKRVIDELYEQGLVKSVLQVVTHFKIYRVGYNGLSL